MGYHPEPGFFLFLLKTDKIRFQVDTASLMAPSKRSAKVEYKRRRESISATLFYCFYWTDDRAVKRKEGDGETGEV